MAQQQVTLAPGESRTVSFEAVPEEAGTYQVLIDGLSGSFVAVAPGVIIDPEREALLAQLRALSYQITQGIMALASPCRRQVQEDTQEKIRAGELPSNYYPRAEYDACSTQAAADYWAANPDIKAEYDRLTGMLGVDPLHI